MIWLSLAVFSLMCFLHVPTNHSPLDPISNEIEVGNGLGWLLMFGLCGVVLQFAYRLKKCGHSIRAGLLLLDAVGLLVVAFSPPSSRIHTSVLALVAVFTIVWFMIMAVDYNSHGLVCFSAVAVFFLLMLCVFSLGLAEKGLILYSLVASNLFYYNGLGDENEAARRRWY